MKLGPIEPLIDSSLVVSDNRGTKFRMKDDGVWLLSFLGGYALDDTDRVYINAYCSCIQTFIYFFFLKSGERKNREGWIRVWRL